MTSLPERIVEVSRALDSAGVPHAFGGAIALAFCIPEPRATADLDINIFLSVGEATRALDALPAVIERDEHSLELAKRGACVYVTANELEDQLRNGSLVGLREDETPRDVRREGD